MTSTEITLEGGPRYIHNSKAITHFMLVCYLMDLEHVYHPRLYSLENWTCMSTALLSSMVHTNLQSVKSDLIKIVWIKFDLRFESPDLLVCVYELWYNIYTALSWEYAQSVLAVQGTKTKFGSWPPIQTAWRFFFIWPRQGLWKGYDESSKESEVGKRRKERYTKRIHLKFSLCWLLNTASSWESSSELGCQSATSQYEQQKMSRHRKPFETCFYRNEKIWHTHTYEDDNKKPLWLFETFKENPNKSLISNIARQTSQVTDSP